MSKLEASMSAILLNTLGHHVDYFIIEALLPNKSPKRTYYVTQRIDGICE